MAAYVPNPIHRILAAVFLVSVLLATFANSLESDPWNTNAILLGLMFGKFLYAFANNLAWTHRYSHFLYLQYPIPCHARSCTTIPSIFHIGFSA